MSNSNSEKNPHGVEIPIHIEQTMYKATKALMTGAELRLLAEPHIAANRDLFRTVPGPDDDQLVEDGTAIELKPGMHFYSAPKTINPGSHNGPA